SEDGLRLHPGSWPFPSTLTFGWRGRRAFLALEDGSLQVILEEGAPLKIEVSGEEAVLERALSCEGGTS
ncbi:MAG: glycosyl hydrolase family 65 protein, partial [Bacteroidota bacterium]